MEWFGPIIQNALDDLPLTAWYLSAQLCNEIVRLNLIGNMRKNKVPGNIKATGSSGGSNAKPAKLQVLN
jgi:hypothetical protein